MYNTLLVTIQISFIKIIQNEILAVIINQGSYNVVTDACTGYIDTRGITKLNNKYRVFICDTAIYKLLIIQVCFNNRSFIIIAGIITYTTNNEICKITIGITRSVFCIQTQLSVTVLIIDVFGKFEGERKFSICNRSLAFI